MTPKLGGRLCMGTTADRSCMNATAGLLLVLLMTYMELAPLYLCVCMYNEYKPYNMVMHVSYTVL